MIGLGTLMWGVTAASLVGTVANIKRLQWCFLIWGFTNTAWMAYDLYIGAYAQAALFFVNVLFSIWGLYAWGKTE